MAKYLITGPSWVGDMVMAQSLFTTIKQREPEAIIDVVGPAWSAPIVRRMPEVRRVIVLDSQHGKWGFGSRYRLGRVLAKEKYDKAIVLPRSWKSALVSYFARIKHRIGFHGEQRFFLLNERRRLDRKLLDQTVKRFVSLGLPIDEAYPPAQIPHPSLTINRTASKATIERLNLRTDRPAVALMPGAEYGPAKQWPLEYFRILAEYFLEKKYQVWVLGSAKDYPAGEKITLGLRGDSHNLCGRTELEEVIDLLSETTMAITNDSGLMHIAAAVGTHIHAIYGSTSEDFTPALSKKVNAHNLHLACSPCFKRVCPLGHTNCLKKITPEHLIRAIDTTTI